MALIKPPHSLRASTLCIFSRRLFGAPDKDSRKSLGRLRSFLRFTSIANPACRSGICTVRYAAGRLGHPDVAGNIEFKVDAAFIYDDRCV